MDLATPIEPPLQRKRAARERGTTSAHALRLTRWVRLEVAVASVRGRRREVNEDWHSTLNGSTPVFVVADGVGGGVMAAQASRELVSRLHHSLDGRRFEARAMRDALLRADRDVAESIASKTDGSGAATVALCAGTGALLAKWLIAWVGDCRIYRVGTDGKKPAQLLTVDDTYRHLGEAPPPGGSPDDPARMVGNGAVSAPNVREVALRQGEMLVLCSDGVHKHVDASDLSAVMQGAAPLERRCSRLLALARARGSGDDATVLVVRREPRHERFAWFAAACALLATLVVAWVVASSGMLHPSAAANATRSAGEGAPRIATLPHTDAGVRPEGQWR